MENNNNNQSTFTSIGRSHGAPVLPATRAEWEALRNQPWLAEMCRRIEAGDEKLKHRLPVWTPHCATFRDNHRAAADALQPLQRLMLDFDEKGHSQEILTRAMELQQAGRWQILLVEESVRRGTHILIRLPQGMTPQEAQTRFSADVGFQADGALKDVSRCIYMVPADHTLYVDEEGLFNEIEIAEENANNANFTNLPEKKDDGNPVESPLPTADAPLTFKGIPYSEIIKQWFILAGGEPATGERNTKLHRLAYHLRHITDNDEALLLRIMPQYGLSEEEMKSLIHSACTAAWCGMPKMMQQILARTVGAESCKDEVCNTSTPPEMPKKLPPLIKLLVSRTPDLYKPAVAHAVFPSLAAHLHRVRFKYIDNVEHEATLMNVLYAGFNNPITVSASGVPSNKVSVSMQGGSLTPAGTGKFIARPSAVGKPVTFSVSGEVGGRMQPLGEFTFQVRKLPDPTAYIRIGDDHFAGGRLAKARVLSAPGIGAAIDDGLLNIPFRVLSFETTFFDNMGNARPETASGDAFTENQRNLMRSLRRGQRFYISNVKAVGPDGITRTLPQALPVIVN